MNLQLSLKRQWFEMTKAGIKPEDYREITPYWVKRLIQFNSHECDLFFAVEQLKKGQDHKDSLYQQFNFSFYFPKKFTQTTLTLGYPKSTDTERIVKYEHAGIEVRTGNPDWGAEPNKLYFVIMHGARL
jgi:hypothetical protein